ncbi:MAG: hypothetical protein JWN76_341 [Chitinophagaceae bacterium]|nr:hypothetical protein [Chitinophagaceae bacterium]
MKKINSFLFACIIYALPAHAQELEARVTVNAQKINTTVDKKIFNTLQTQLNNFLNNRKWTNDNFHSNEKIECHFLLSIDNTSEANVYEGKLTVQAARPVYNSDYKSPLVNYQDGDITFKYVEFQPIEFNENRIQGTDAYSSNLTAILAYYAYIILGLDYDSFSPKGGTPYFQKALNIVNNAPEARNISGWKAFDGLRNRYWLAENLVNSKYNLMHDGIYTYFRSSLDKMYNDEGDARKNILDALNRLQTMNKDNPNSMILQFFVSNRATEMIGIMKKGTPQEKRQAVDILSQLDIANIARYKQELK